MDIPIRPNQFEIRRDVKTSLVYNICGINSLIHGFAKLQMETQFLNSTIHQCKLFEIVKLISSGEQKKIVDEAVFQMVVDKSLFLNQHQHEDRYNCVTTIAHVMENSLPTSILAQCRECHHTRVFKYISLTLRNGNELSAIEKLVQDELNIDKCFTGACNDEILVNYGDFLAIETIFFDKRVTMKAQKIPKHFSLNGVAYKLSFFIILRLISNNLNHFMCMFLDDDTFIKYDCLQKFAKHSIKNENVLPQALIYKKC